MRGDGGEDEFLGGMGSLQSMGILNALRTGDPTMDMVLAMSLPLVLKLLVQMLCEIQMWLKRMDLLGSLDKRLHERSIVQATTRDRYGYSNTDDNDSQNTVLLKAIRLYLHKVVQLKLREADLDLTSIEDKNASVGRSRYYYYDSDSDDDDDENDSKTVVGALSKYSIVKKPRPNHWYKIGEYGKLEPAEVKLRIEHNEEENGEKNDTSTRITHQFRFQSESGEAIDHFIDKVYQWYMEELRKLEDNSRYLYELKTSPPSSQQNNDDHGDGSTNENTYRRYRLSDEKTFNSLFFRQKQSLLKLVDHFQKKSGKYAIEGYPHKLGILLHGPPGSGKTSLIKALAQYTGRSIVNVPLARVSTNAQLMSIFFDRRKQVEGEHIPVKLGFKDVIFVMEDVDAASKIVKRRDGKKVASLEQQQQRTSTPELLEQDIPNKSLWHMLLESNEPDCKDLVKLLIEQSEDLKKEACQVNVALGVAQRAIALPGLALVGAATSNTTVNNDDAGAALEKMSEDAVNNARKIMDNQSTIDQYLAKHARILLNMLEQGTPVDKALVDELLGRSPRREFFAASRSSSPSLASSDNDNSIAEDREDDVPVAANTNTSALESAALMEMRMLAEGNTDSSNKIAGEGGSSSFIGPATAASSLWNKPGKDQLNLTGLLNVLDGVVDSPKRIVIMTTNHVEHLDPALVRPGRIDKKLLLGYMEAPDVIQMLEHYFLTRLSDQQKLRVETAMARPATNNDPLKMTPAQIEQLTAEHDDVEEMIAVLEERSKLGAAARLS